MNLSQACIDLVKRWEGYRDEAYDDGGGVWTIGYGTIRYPNGKSVQKGDTCSQDEAEQWLHDELLDSEDAVNNLVDVDLTQYQFDALVSFVYNCGQGAFRSSTMRKLLNSSDYNGAALQFPRWCKDNGQVVQGLLNRRKDEQRMFQGLA